MPVRVLDVISRDCSLNISQGEFSLHAQWERELLQVMSLRNFPRTAQGQAHPSIWMNLVNAFHEWP